MASTKPIVPDLRVRLRRLLRQQKHTDCSFRIDNTVISSHKIILAIASPVFEAMLFGPLAETGRIHIADIGPDAFRLMLEYIYTDELDPAGSAQIEDLIELYYCAEKYMLTELLLETERRIRRSLRHDNILQAIDAAVALDIGALLDLTVGTFAEYCLHGRFFARLLASNQFHMAKDTLNYILARTDLRQQTIQLLCLVQRWCRTEAIGVDADDMRQTLRGVRLPESLTAAAVLGVDDDGDGGDNDGDERKTMEASRRADRTRRSLMRITAPLAWIACQRQQFRAVRPLRQTAGQPSMRFDTSLRASRFIAVRSLCINSRLAPVVRTPRTAGGLPDDGYTEQLTVAVCAPGESGDAAHRQTFVVFHAEYNSTVSLVFDEPVLMAPDQGYAIALEWPACTQAVGREYPRTVMAASERPAGDVCELQFDGHLSEEGDWMVMSGLGSVLVGVEFMVLR